ncbi:hypothetical protein ACFE04_029779 [Oxalis oulophora]
MMILPPTLPSVKIYDYDINLVRWKQKPGYLTVNLDARLVGGATKVYADAYIGVILRDVSSKFSVGFAGWIEDMTYVLAELNSFEYAILLLIREDIPEDALIEVQSDCSKAVNFITCSENDLPNDEYEELVKRIRLLLKSFTNLEVKFVPREANEVADALVRDFKDKERKELKYVPECSARVNYFLNKDLNKSLNEDIKRKEVKQLKKVVVFYKKFIFVHNMYYKL